MALFQIILKDMMCICIVSTINMKKGDITKDPLHLSHLKRGSGLEIVLFVILVGPELYVVLIDVRLNKLPKIGLRGLFLGLKWYF